jgi:prepilin-type processing-associated H-X9-DG protein
LHASGSNKKTSDVYYPEKTIFIGDVGFPSRPTIAPEKWSDDIGYGNWGYMRFPDDGYFWGGGEQWDIFPRHLGKATVLFYDGHADSVHVTKDVLAHYPGDGACLYDNEP